MPSPTTDELPIVKPENDNGAAENNGAPPWARELIEELKRQGRKLDELGDRLERVERAAGRMNRNLGVLGSAYQVLGSSIETIRLNCPECVRARMEPAPPIAIHTTAGKPGTDPDDQ